MNQQTGIASPDPIAELLSAATRGEYDIYGELGRGGMAAVYLGLDIALNRKVAIKTMLPELVEREGMVQRFRREAQTAAGLSHPHIIPIYSVKATPDLVFFVMKFVEGRSLESLVAESGPVSLEMARVVVEQVAGALSYAHRKGVVHRDIKPANIMIDDEGRAIVTDFGIAKVQEAQNLTATGTAIGTPHYMSPEQFHNKSITGSSDQYSLGIVAFEMLTGKKPFNGSTYAEIITKHLFEPPPDMRAARPDLPESIAAAVTRMLAKEPEERFPDLDAAVAAFGAASGEEGRTARTQMVNLATSARPAAAALPRTNAATRRVPSRPATATPSLIPETRAAANSGRGPLLAAAIALLVVGGVGVYGWSNSRTIAPTAAEYASVVPSGEPIVDSSATPTALPVASAPQSTPPVASQQQSEPEVPAERDLASPENDAGANPPATLPAETTPPGSELAPTGARATAPTQTRPNATELANRRQRVADALQRANEIRRQTPVPTATMATLRIGVSVPAALYIDGVSRGTRNRAIEQVTPGTHRIRVERMGFFPKDTTVELRAGDVATILLKLQPRR